MFDKRLLLMIPFFLVRYEKTLMKDNPDNAEWQDLSKEAGGMLDRIKEPSDGSREFDLNLTDLINKIMAYLCRKSDKNRERLGEIMGGKVLELASDRLRAEGRMEGREEGRAEGRAELCRNLIIKGMISYEEASLESGLSIETLKEAVEAAMNSK